MSEARDIRVDSMPTAPDPVAASPCAIPVGVDVARPQSAITSSPEICAQPVCRNWALANDA
jgi:hypothetical protein